MNLTRPFINEMTLRNMMIEAHVFDRIRVFSPDHRRELRRTVFLKRRAAARTGPWHQLYRAARDSPGIDN